MTIDKYIGDPNGIVIGRILPASPEAGMRQWEAREWKGRDSWDIYQGDKMICADLLYREASVIVAAHNATLSHTDRGWKIL